MQAPRYQDVKGLLNRTFIKHFSCGIAIPPGRSIEFLSFGREAVLQISIYEDISQYCLVPAMSYSPSLDFPSRLSS
jgi:hypothetical protein